MIRVWLDDQRYLARSDERCRDMLRGRPCARQMGTEPVRLSGSA